MVGFLCPSMYSETLVVSPGPAWCKHAQPVCPRGGKMSEVLPFLKNFWTVPWVNLEFFSSSWQRFCTKLRKWKWRRSTGRGVADGCSFPTATVDQRADGVLQANSWFSLGLLSIVVCHRYLIQQLVGTYKAALYYCLYMYKIHILYYPPYSGLHVLWTKAGTGGLG